MKRKRPSRGGLALCVLCLCAGTRSFAGEPIRDEVKISKEAEAARAGAAYHWDIQAIRKALEARAERIKYTGAAKGAVMTVPGAAELKARSVEALFAMCKHWNPAVAAAAGRELGRRGMTVYDKVMANTASDDPAIRAASAEVITGFLAKLRTEPKDSDFRAFMAEKYPAIVAAITTLIADRDLHVRRSIEGALYGVGVTARGMKVDLGPMATAAMRQASVEPDPHLCQDLCITARRFKWQMQLDPKTRAEVLGRMLLAQPFPRGRGSVVLMIRQLPPKEIEATLPALLTHFKTPLLRDTMFFPGGAPEAFVLIVEHRAAAPAVFTEALANVNRFNRQAWVSLQGKWGKALKPYFEALAGLGSEAAVALPSLRELVAEADGEAAAYGQSVIRRISQ